MAHLNHSQVTVHHLACRMPLLTPNHFKNIACGQSLECNLVNLVRTIISLHCYRLQSIQAWPLNSSKCPSMAVSTIYIYLLHTSLFCLLSVGAGAAAAKYYPIDSCISAIPGLMGPQFLFRLQLVRGHIDSASWANEMIWTLFPEIIEGHQFRSFSISLGLSWNNEHMFPLLFFPFYLFSLVNAFSLVTYSTLHGGVIRITVSLIRPQRSGSYILRSSMGCHLRSRQSCWDAWISMVRSGGIFSYHGIFSIQINTATKTI